MNSGPGQGLNAKAHASLSHTERSSPVPLKQLTINLPTTTDTKMGSSVDKASGLVDSFFATKQTADHANLSLAFVCLYKGTHNHEERVRLVKRHQHFVVFLNAKMLHEAALKELSVIYNVFTSSLISITRTPEILLRGVSPKNKFPLQTLISFHFFVIQSVLQMVSSRVQSIIKNCSQTYDTIFWEVVRAFLRGANFDKCLSLCDAISLRKYHLNALKMLSGFTKVAIFIHSRVSNSKLDKTIYALKLKVLQHQIRTNSKITSEPPPMNDNLLAPFVRDLLDVLSHTQDFNNLSLLRELRNTCSRTLADVDACDSETMVQSQELTDTLDLSAKQSTLLSCEPVNQYGILDFPLHASLYPSTVLAISSLLKLMPVENLNETHISVLDSCLVYLAHAISDHLVFHRCLEELVPTLSRLLIREKSMLNAKRLSRVCFEFAKTSDLAEGYAQACQLDVAILSMSEDLDSGRRISNRIEHSICCLFDLAAYSQAVHLTKEYIGSAGTRLPGERFFDILTECMVFEPEVLPFFFGENLCFELGMQRWLFHNLLVPLKAKLSAGSDFLVQNLIAHQPKKLPLETQYMLSRLFDVEPSHIESEEPSVSSDCLVMAGILVNSFRKDKFELSTLNKIVSYSSKWLMTASESDLKSQFSIFREILNELSLMGFYHRCVRLIGEFKSSQFDEPRSLFELESLLSRCILELSDIGSLPLILRNCGILFKRIYTGAVGEFDELLNLKLTRLEFFIRMRDETKSRRKFQEIMTMISSRCDYNLENESKELMLEGRIACFITIARFLLLTSMFNTMSAEILCALKNLKLSIKLLSSVLRKLDSLPELVQAKSRALLLLLTTYKLAFKAARHLGLSKEAIYYIGEFTKLNSLLFKSPVKSFNNFISANYLMYVNKQKEAVEEYNKGSCDTWSSTSLKIAQLITFVTLNLDSMSNESLKMRRENLKLLLLELQDTEIKGHFTAPILQVTELVLEAESLMIESFGQGFPEFQLEEPNMVEMLVRAVFLVRSKLSEISQVSPTANEISKFDSLVGFLPSRNGAQLNTSYRSEQSVIELTQCKEILLRFAEQKFLRHLEIGIMHDVSSLLSRCVFLLSYFGYSQEEEVKKLLKTSFSIKDLAQSLPYVNQKALLAQSIPLHMVLLPELSIEGTGDFSPQEAFYEDLHQLLPACWAVVTLDICQISGDLIISRLNSDSNHPIVLKLPFDRRETDKNSFSDYLRELRSIISDSNRSTKSAVTSKIRTKEDRKLWWTQRFELDTRLKDLLNRIQRLTIGGLLGTFGTLDTKTREYQLFELELRTIWNVAVSGHSEVFQLEKSTVDFFYYVCANRQDLNSEIDLLADLTDYTIEQFRLYACVSFTLRKNKEWITERISGLCTEKLIKGDAEHLILIPSNACSLVPWESMACLRNRSISRMPSVACLVDSLRRHQGQMTVYKNGSEKLLYILNPGADLINTQSRFKPLFNQLLGATGLTGEHPSEEWLMTNLYNSNLYIYLGHGGGEQYLRSSSLFRLRANSDQDLPTALLMGCSSSAYQEHGRLQPSSNMFNWFVCGAPAVMTNLWDITDKDIDIFSLSLFAEWGLDTTGTPKVKTLSQAMVNSRNACTLKYLNGAAPVLYGLPLTLK